MTRTCARLHLLVVFLFNIEACTCRNSVGMLPCKHAAGAGSVFSWDNPACRDYHATNSYLSLRQDPKRPPDSARYPWFVNTSSNDFPTRDTELPAAGPTHRSRDSVTPQDAVVRSNDRVATSRAMSLDGRECGAQWLSELVPSVEEVTRALGRPPGLCVIHVGERSDSRLYVSKKEEACKQVCA